MRNLSMKVLLASLMLTGANVAWASTLSEDDGGCSGACATVSDCDGKTTFSGTCICFANPFGPHCFVS